MMRTILLREHRTSSPISLTQRELSLILATRLVDVTPGDDEATFVLRPGSIVGTVVFDSFRLLIRPKVALENVFFLLGFRPGLMRWRRPAFEYERAPDLLNVMARLFDAEVQHAMPRGVARGYVAREESLMTVRGRIDLAAQVSRRAGASLPLECRFDEFTEDIMLNRLLKDAGRRLLSIPGLEPEVRRGLAFHRRLFADVSEVGFHPAAVPTVTFSRLNNHWETSVRLAELILRQAAVRDAEGVVVGSSFLVDMNEAFEKFLEEVFRSEMRRAGWDLAPQQTRRLTEKITLRPDFIVQRSGRDMAVADAKYKELPAGVWDQGDVYQMIAYCVALRLPRATLVYACDRPRETHTVFGNGAAIDLVGLDLGAPTAQILERTKLLARALLRDARAQASIPVEVAS